MTEKQMNILSVVATLMYASHIPQTRNNLTSTP